SRPTRSCSCWNASAARTRGTAFSGIARSAAPSCTKRCGTSPTTARTRYRGSTRSSIRRSRAAPAESAATSRRGLAARPPGSGRRRRRDFFRRPCQVAMSAVSPERLEEVPILEERPAAAGTCEARHPASGPGDRAHPGERDDEKRRPLEKRVVQQIGKQSHSRNEAEEQQPENLGPAMQVKPCRLEGGIDAHVSPPAW